MKIETSTIYLKVDGKSLQFDYPIAEVLTVGELIIVRLDIPQGIEYNRNVFGIDTDLRIKWQIEESPHGTQTDKPFMKIWISKESQLLAGNWIGVDYKVNLENGQLLPKSLSK